MSTEDQIRDVKRRHSAELMSLPGVCGVGVAKGQGGGLVIAVHLDTDDPAIAARIPKEIEGFAVETIHSGPFYKSPGNAAKA
jgi:hypothetical protein